MKVVEIERGESTYAKETLADYLKQAEAGEICAIGVVLIKDNGSITSDYSVDKYIHMDTLIGALEHLKYRILSQKVQEENERSN